MKTWKNPVGIAALSVVCAIGFTQYAHAADAPAQGQNQPGATTGAGAGTGAGTGTGAGATGIGSGAGAAGTGTARTGTGTGATGTGTGTGATGTGTGAAAVPGNGIQAGGGAQAGGPLAGHQQMNEELAKISQSNDAADKLFVYSAGVCGQLEVLVAQQAEKRSQDPQVKKIAEQLIKDHQQANQQLTSVAEKLGVQLSPTLPMMKQTELLVLERQEGKKFDQAFLAWAEEEHAHDIACFRNKAAMADDAAVKEFAAQNLPVLEKHMEMIQQAAVALGVPSDSAQPAGAHLQGSGNTAGQGTHSTNETTTGTGSRAK